MPDGPGRVPLRRLTLGALLLPLVLSTCGPAPEGPRVLDVRTGVAAPVAPQPDRLLTLDLAVTPTFPTLELHQPGALDVHLSRGWERDPFPSFLRQGVVRFWVGEPRPLRLRARARIVGEPAGSEGVLGVGLGARELGTAALSPEPSEATFDIPPEALHPGANVLFLWRRGEGRVVFDELVLDDAEEPRAVPAPRVLIDVEREPEPRQGVEVDRDGRLAYLLHLPDNDRTLRVGLTCRQGVSREPPRFRIVVDSDEGQAVLAEGEASYDQIVQHEASLAVLSRGGRPIRLSLEVTRLPQGARCAWVEPHLVAETPDRSVAPPAAPRLNGANIIVVVLDAAARDRFGLYGSTEGSTPVYDTLGDESVVFDRAVAQASYTTASTASLFTGRLPPAHQVTRRKSRAVPSLPPSVPTFAEALGEAGYETALFTGNPNASARGISRGFGAVRNVRASAPATVAMATQLTGEVRRWLDTSPRSPFFLYVHSVQPHAPYDAAPERFYRGLTRPQAYPVDGSLGTRLRLERGDLELDAEERAYMRGLYHGNLRYADQALAELIGLLRERDLLESSVLAVTSDHGESLGERGRYGHGNNVDRETSPIPLLVRFPERFGLTGRVDLTLGNVDLLPTLLDFVGVPAPAGTWGRSHLPLLAHPDATRWPRPTLSWAGGSRSGTIAVYGADCKYVFDNRTNGESLFTFEEQEDGGDIQAERPVTFDYLAHASFPRLTAGATGEASETETLDAETIEALRALGYVE